MVSPWSKRGSVMEFIKVQPDVDRYDLCTQIAGAVVHLHQFGVIHGDLKGANILVSDDGMLQLTDFGLAIMRDTTIQFSRSSNVTGGTVRWMAPELLFGSETGGNTASRSLKETVSRATESESDSGTTLSKETDIYALGMTMLELLTGEHPFNHVKRDAAVIHKVGNSERPNRPTKILDQSTQGTPFWEILQKCWAQKPADRPTANEVVALMSQLGNK